MTMWFFLELLEEAVLSTRGLVTTHGDRNLSVSSLACQVIQYLECFVSDWSNEAHNMTSSSASSQSHFFSNQIEWEKIDIQCHLRH